MQFDPSSNLAQPTMSPLLPNAAAPKPQGLANSTISATNRFDAATESVAALAIQYGRIRAALCLDENKLHSLTHELSTATRALSLYFKGNEHLATAFKREIHDAVDDERLQGLQEVAIALGSKCGHAQGRKINETTVKDSREKFATYCEQNSDLFRRYQGLAVKASELFDRGVQIGVEKLHRAEKDAIRCSRALVRIPPTHREIEEILLKRSPEQIADLNEAFLQRYGMTLRQRIETMYSLPIIRNFGSASIKLSELRNLMENNQVGAAADRLALAIGGRKKNFFPKYIEILQSISGQEILRMKELFTFLYPHLGKRLSAKQLPRLTTSHKAECNALENDDRMLGKAIALHNLLAAKRNPFRPIFKLFSAAGELRPLLKISTILEPQSREDRQRLTTVYENRFGVPLKQNLLQTYSSSGARDRIVALLEDNPRMLTASTLRQALETHDIPRIGGFFLGGDEAKRSRIIHEYKQIYGDFWKDFEALLPKVDRNFLRPIINTGALNAAETIYRCVVGLGTDEYGIIRLLKDLSLPEIELLSSEYSNLYTKRHGKPQNLRERLDSECSGDGWRDIRILYDEGAPSTPKEMVRRWQRQLGDERSGGWFKRTDIISNEGRTMEKDVSDVTNYYRNTVEGAELTPEMTKRLHYWGRIIQRDFTAFRTLKNEIADLFSTVTAGALGATTILTILHYGGGFEHNILKIAGGVFASALGARILVKKLLKGSSYGTEEAAKDLLLSAIEGCAPMVSKFLTGTIARKLVNIGTKISLKQVVRISGQFAASEASAYCLSRKDLERVFEGEDNDSEHWWSS